MGALASSLVAFLFGNGIKCKGHRQTLGNRHTVAQVLIDREQFISGQIDLKEHLGSIPASKVREMQLALASHKREFQYSLDDDDGDAIAVLLDGVRNVACPRPQLFSISPRLTI